MASKGGGARPPRIRVQIKDTDHGYQAMMKRINDAQRAVLSVGITGQGGSLPHKGGGGMTVLGIATIHEFGLGVPERSFIRAWYDQFFPQARKMITIMVQSVVKGNRTKAEALDLLGVRFVAEVQKFIVDAPFAPLAPATIRAKGSSKPLIDTGQLRSSVTFRIELNGGQENSGDRSESVAIPPPAPKPPKPPTLKQRLKGLRKGATRLIRQGSKETRKLAKQARRGTRRLLRQASRTQRVLLRQAARAQRNASRILRRSARNGAKVVKRNVKKATRAVKRNVKKANRGFRRLLR